MHLAAAQILTYSMGVPFWCHPTSGKTVALTHGIVHSIMKGRVQRWVGAGVKSMEELDPREIVGLRVAIDSLVVAFLRVSLSDLYATVPQGTELEGQPHQGKNIEKPGLDGNQANIEVVVIESDKENEVIRTAQVSSEHPPCQFRGSAETTRLLENIVLDQLGP